MKRFYLILLSAFIQSLTKAQSPKDNVLGHYVGMERQTDTNTGNFFDCPNAIYNVKATSLNYPEIRIDDTSCWYTGGVAGSFIVYDDSTIRHYWTQTYVYGKLYENDSLYFKWWYACCPEIQVEFFGFKQYGFPAPIGIKEYADFTYNLVLSPQPAADLLYIQSEQLLFTALGGPVLYDLNGRKMDVRSKYVNNNTYTIDVSDLPSGIYILGIETDKGLLRKKVLVGN